MKNSKIAAGVLMIVVIALVFGITACDRGGATISGSTAILQPSITTSSADVTIGPTTAATPSQSITVSSNLPTVISTTSASQTPDTRTITDMYGRSLTIPSHIDRVLTSGPIEMELVYLIAPEKLVGLNFSFNGKPPLVSPQYSSLPVIGGWFGTQTGNYETFIAADPDIVLEGTEANILERQQKFGDIPVIGLYAGDKLTNYDDDALTGYESEIRFLGELLEAQPRAERLIAYYKESMNYVRGIVSDIPENEKIKVYYAEGKEGFNTDPVGSMHTRLLEFCGGLNVADVNLQPGYGMAETSLEQILLWDPDMIIIGRGSQINLFNSVMTGSGWSQLKAVRDQKVEIRPDNPFSWFDGPPGPCQIVGMYWMINKLYPDKTSSLDVKAKVKEFYLEFFHFDLTEQELSNLLTKPVLP